MLSHLKSEYKRVKEEDMLEEAIVVRNKIREFERKLQAENVFAKWRSVLAKNPLSWKSMRQHLQAENGKVKYFEQRYPKSFAEIAADDLARAAEVQEDALRHIEYQCAIWGTSRLATIQRLQTFYKSLCTEILESQKAILSFHSMAEQGQGVIPTLGVMLQTSRATSDFLLGVSKIIETAERCRTSLVELLQEDTPELPACAQDLRRALQDLGIHQENFVHKGIDVIMLTPAPPCAICLLPAKDGKSVSESVYHTTCANFWLRRVNKTLPVIPSILPK
eukprot:TRINITY_DN2001_c0_g1_i2.p1 TRINITY_DN2001_c0_g1~~TRINITY_DN2001_c0_g1_i2.p1  ORF type:complete len:278 (+),score=42.47 TRINITY_DN2001_c0_g1_i2:150-983(+)